MSKYSFLSSTMLEVGASYHRILENEVEIVGLDDPAVRVMTDLKNVPAITIEPGLSIDAANHKMIASGVRMLLVTDAWEHVLGIITATDILGEKPIQHLGKVGGDHRDILVQDIMTPQSALEVLQMVDIERAQVGDIVETLKRAGRQHAAVVEIDESNMAQKIRGIFSSTQISRQLGIKLDLPEIASSFAEVEQALAH
jgi:CBS domain containing-hemolysin-like protein